MRHFRCALPVALALLAILVLSSSRADALRDVDFVRDVQPILQATCYDCHGPVQHKARLRLDARSLALKGGISGAVIVPGKSSDSPLYQRLIEKSDEDRMPQDHAPLKPGQIELIRQWIDRGAGWPDSAANEQAVTDKHWAYQQPVRVQPPAVENPEWCITPIDRFILSRLQQRHLSPAAPAGKHTLLRRLTLDLTGLPPTLAELDDFLADESADAYGKVVDRLLASPRYGERMARQWMDLARYAESEGFKADETRPYAWRYRDWLIDAFNADMPYDRFVQEQLAGDELFPDDPQAQVATAFNRHYPDESNARNLFQRRSEILADITDTVGATFFAMTFACARCHNHKYDEIAQADYYKLQAFFANIRARDDLRLQTPQEESEYRAKLAAWESKTAPIRQQMAAIEEPRRQAILKDYWEKYPPEVKAVLQKPAGQRTPLDWQIWHKAMLYLGPDSPQYLAPTSTVIAQLKGDARKRWDELKTQLDQFASEKPPEPPRGTGICDAGPVAPPTYLLKRSVYDAYGPEVVPGFPVVLDPKPAVITPVANTNSTGRRAALARWLTRADNPLTARIIVNRLWQWHFGTGIVATSGDFGTQGDRPSHPELLDWLATEFVHNGWSMKSMHRLIVMSAAYRQSSVSNSAALAADPESRLLWRFPPQRLEGEAIRDSALAVSGLLNDKMHGPSIFPELPPGMPARGGWPVTSSISERDRRSVYVFVRRNTRYPLFEAFDMPDTHESCPRRAMTVTPIQALTLLNSKQTLEWAQALAGRVAHDASGDRDAQIRVAYRLAYCRTPVDDERSMVQRFFERQKAIVAARLDAHQKLAEPVPPDDRIGPVDGAVLVDFCHALINSNEFVHRD